MCKKFRIFSFLPKSIFAVSRNRLIGINLRDTLTLIRSFLTDDGIFKETLPLDSKWKHKV